MGITAESDHSIWLDAFVLPASSWRACDSLTTGRHGQNVILASPVASRTRKTECHRTQSDVRGRTQLADAQTISGTHAITRTTQRSTSEKSFAAISKNLSRKSSLPQHRYRTSGIESAKRMGAPFAEFEHANLTFANAYSRQNLQQRLFPSNKTPSVAARNRSLRQFQLLSQHRAFVGGASCKAPFDQIHRFAGTSGSQSQNGVITAFPVRTRDQHGESTLDSPCSTPLFTTAEQ